MRLVLQSSYSGCAQTSLLLLVVIFMSVCSPNANAQAWRDAANARIDSHRKSDLTVQVVDENGLPVEGASIRVEMKQHTFRFGTAVTAGLINDNSATGQTYRAKLLENFNEVVFENDLKWPAWDGLWGNGFNWNNTRSAIEWLDSQSIPARGHYLSWATWSGDDAHGGNSDTNTLKQRLLDHMTDKAGTVGDRVYEWDVINHPVGWTGTTYENLLGGTAIFADIVDHARSVVPEGTPLWINEDDVVAGDSRAGNYERIIEYLNDNGSPVDGIGFQGHFIEDWGRVSNSTPEQVYNRIDRFKDLASSLRMTEFDIDVGGDENLQGQLMRDYLTAMFSHESIEAVTMWGFWGGAHWRGDNGALYRNDWTEKPSLTAYQDLVFDEWWTDETGDSDSSGLYDVRAFDGLYDITATVDGEDYVLTSYTLAEDGTVQVVVPPMGLPGDFNEDGQVDAADYTTWRDNPAAFPEDAYQTWVDNFGSTSPSTAIPEPTTMALLLGLSVVATTRTQYRPKSSPSHFVGRN